ncbi:MAG: NADH-quinone oxidoreductase subunit L, partial [Myxococcales bacterium]
MEVGWLHLVPLLPLLGAIFNGLAGRWVPKSWVYTVALLAILCSFLLGLSAFLQVAGEGGESAQIHETVYTWFAVGNLHVDVALALDRLSGTLVLVITGVGFLIHLYSVGYIDEDPGYWRYFAYLNLFVAAMLLLVLGDNLVAMFVGWEGVGLCSYLLIGFWFDDDTKAYAGRKAFVTNRIGDFGFLIGLFALFSIFGTASYGELQAAARAIGDPSQLIQGGLFAGRSFQWAITFALLGLFVGACGKSAQLPLYVWLPDAMAGPTPVSALIHAATMVTAGVYLVARNSYLFSLAPAAMATVTLVGACTALFAALIAFVQTDIKKVLAYSTVSQLGFMFIGVGCGAWWAGVLHLVTHAFFKGCLFLGAGSVMHGMGDETDIRKMGGLWRKMPWTALTFGIATISATGIIPLAGFWSKDAILGNAMFSHNSAWHQVGPLAYGIGAVAALGTAFYRTRLYALTVLGAPRTPAAEHAHESSPVMWVPLLVLAVAATVALVLALPGSMIFEHYLAPVFQNGTQRLLATHHFHEGAHPAWPYFAAWVIAAAGTLVAWVMYVGPKLAWPSSLADLFPRLYRFTLDKFRVDELYQATVLG